MDDATAHKKIIDAAAAAHKKIDADAAAALKKIIDAAAARKEMDAAAARKKIDADAAAAAAATTRIRAGIEKAVSGFHHIIIGRSVWHFVLSF